MDQQALAALLQRHGIQAHSLAPLQDSNCSLSIAGAEALALWHRLRALVDRTGFWPILLGGEQDMEEYGDDAWDIWEQPTRLIEAGERLDPHAWIQERLVELERPPARGPWPMGAEPAATFTIPYDLMTQQPLPAVHVAMVPTLHGWQAPAFLRYGGWNACPNPEQHVAMFKHWEAAYGAEPLGMARDRVELLVSRPPADRESALALAREQYAYCSDIVDQGTETLDVLATGLLRGTAWYFWWD